MAAFSEGMQPIPTGLINPAATLLEDAGSGVSIIAKVGDDHLSHAPTKYQQCLTNYNEINLFHVME